MGVNTIHELHKKLVNGQISAVELTQRYIDRKDNSESDIQAFLSDSREAALAVAALVDKKIAAGEDIADLAEIPEVFPELLKIIFA